MAANQNGGTAWRGFAVLVVVFLAGALGGSVVGRMALRRELDRRPPIASAERRGAGSSVDIDQIPTPLLQLDLTLQQQAQLHDIARRWRPRAANELSEVRHHVADLENGMFADMLCVMTPAQRDKYLSILHDAHMPQEVIDKRFANVRANTCPQTDRPR